MQINVFFSSFILIVDALAWREGVKNALEHRGRYTRERGVPSGSARLNTRMPADVHVIPACHGSAASTDFPLFVVH